MDKKDTPELFNRIYKDYDRLNHIMSLGLDKSWRKKFCDLISDRKYNVVLDVASGTGDLLVEMQQQIAANELIAIDPSENMLKICKQKLPNIKTIVSSAENLNIPDSSADLVTVAFGIRNFANIEDSFLEFNRVLSENGILSIMEFSKPSNCFISIFYNFYIKVLIPVFGWLFSKDYSAYKYLQKSIFDFAKINVAKKLEQAGFCFLLEKQLLFGGVRIYVAKKM